MQAAVDMTSKVYWNPTPNRRANPRTPVRMASQIRSDQSDSAYIVIRDISSDGVSFRGFDYFAPGTRITLDLKTAGLTPAVVIWSEAECTGCRFDAPLGDDALESLIGDQPV